MAKLPIVITFVIFLFVPYETNAKCCQEKIRVLFECTNPDTIHRHIEHARSSDRLWESDTKIPACHATICKDGNPIIGWNYCGNGNCNMFGCNCDGGCKSNSPHNSPKEALRIFQEQFNVTNARIQKVSAISTYV